MIVEDHINFLGFGGKSPLVGLNDDRLGPRFPSLNSVYDKQLIVKLLIIIGFML